MSNFEKKVVPYLTYLGTRPILQDELQKYELHHRARIAIKPGITGMSMTYHEDVAAVKDSFKRMLENGVYKTDLFSDL